MGKLGFISANNHTEPYPVYPIGVSYLTTFIRDNLPEYSVDVFDFNLDGGYPELGKWISKGEFDAVAISLRNIDDIDSLSRKSFIGHYCRTMTVIRENTAAPVIIGGPGFSIYPRILLDRLGADFGIKGEGELSLCRLLKALETGSDWKGIEGLVYRDGINPRREFVSTARLEMNGPSVPYYFGRGGMLNVQTKRGCPFGCIYCTYPAIDGRRVRNLEVGQVLDNIVRMYREYGVDYLFFTDSVFNIDREYNRRLCSGIIESGIHLRWGAYFNPRNLTKEDLELYARSGLTHIEWGTDTLADRTLVTYNKGFTWEQIRRANAWAAETGIYQAHFMILGGYGETESTLEETFARSAELESALFFPYIGMRIYPGTELARIAEEEGVIGKDCNLLEPAFYISRDIDREGIAMKAHASGARWIFPGEDDKGVIAKLRERHQRGPLWEYLRF